MTIGTITLTQEHPTESSSLDMAGQEKKNQKGTYIPFETYSDRCSLC
jgi:hypothetical protein